MDPSSKFFTTSTSPALRAAAVALSDSAVLADIPKALYIGTAGHLSVILAGDSVAVTFRNVAAGTILPVRAQKVMLTGTTAADIVALS